VIDAALREVEFILSGSGTIVCREIAPDLLPVECDPDQIQHLLVTLTLCTAQYLPSGSTVFVDAHCADDGVVLNIIDRDRESLLRQFLNRLSGSRSGATGVALAAVYNIVCQHGAKIRSIPNVRKRLGFSLWQPFHRKSPNDSLGLSRLVRQTVKRLVTVR
jgi:signal transduction histidine kinase